MKLIVGLGNPGPKYRGTRHNVGFDVIDELARRAGVAFQSAPVDALMARVRGEPGAIVAKPQTFMNLSGEAVAGLLRYFRVDLADLLVIVDEVQLPLGRLRARRSGSDGGHHGLRSVIAMLGAGTFARLRVGVGRGDARRDLADHVLARFAPDEAPVIQAAVARAADAAEVFVRDGIAAVMNRYNRSDVEQSEEEAEKPDA